ncbi:hypothetical protein THRCLA_07228 [Thraustotheca clavata]|uniref:FYVE-type domain-containing protein n=1 Tax=Thraustotheca clavata TaxID=74557 RepID=A0A1V9ZFK5_9STRA|nr:hypothetical protein THRCLA_07228 [Thraustotheca clavata]
MTCGLWRLWDTTESSMKFPVPDEFFLSPALPVEERRYLTHIARSSCKELIKNARMNGDSVQWMPIGKPDISSRFSSSLDGLPLPNMEIHSMMYEGRSKRDWVNTRKNNMIMGSCVTQVAGTIEEVATFYQRPTTEDARNMGASYEEDFLDTFVLHTLTPPTPENPWHSITVRWYATKSPWSVVKHRDLCYVECQDEFVDVSGRRGWVLARESVALPICPPLAGMNLIRATIERSGLVFLESETPGLLNVIMMSMVDFKGSLPRLMSRLAIRRRLSEVLHLNRFLHERRLSQEQILGDLDLIPKAEREFCNVCNKKFGLFTRHKVRCRKCGEVVCMQCQNMWTVDISMRSTMHNKLYKLHQKSRRNVRICLPCSRETRVRSMTIAATYTNMDTLQALNVYGGVPVAGSTMRESDDMSSEILQSARSKVYHDYAHGSSNMQYIATEEGNEDDDHLTRMSMTDLNYRRSKSLDSHQLMDHYAYDESEDDEFDVEGDHWDHPADHYDPKSTITDERLSLISAADSLSQSYNSSVGDSHMGSYRDSTPQYNYRTVNADRQTRRGSLPPNLNFNYELKQPLYQTQTTEQVIEQLVSSARQMDENRRSSTAQLRQSAASARTSTASGPLRESAGQTFQFCDNKLVGVRSSELKKLPPAANAAYLQLTEGNRTTTPLAGERPWRSDSSKQQPGLFASFNSNHTDSEKTPVNGRSTSSEFILAEYELEDEDKKHRVTELRERMQIMTQDVLRGSGRLTSASSTTEDSEQQEDLMKEHHMPLPRDYFHCADMDAEEEVYLVQVARMACMRLIETSYSPHSEWSTINVRNGVRMSKNIAVPLREDLFSVGDASGALRNSRSRSPTTASASSLHRGITQINATIEEVALQFKVDKGQSIMRSRDILDSMVLYNLTQPTGARPRDSIGITWACVQSPVPFSYNRDFVYLECNEEFTSPDGRRGWAHAMHSVKIPACPPLESLKIIRGSFYYSGFVFLETGKSGELECHYFLEIDCKGSAPQWMSDVMARRKISALSNLNRVLQEQRLESEPLLGDLELPSMREKMECILCYKRFYFFQKKYTCRKCGEAICKRCHSVWELDLPNVGLRRVRICTLCSATTRGQVDMRLVPQSELYSEPLDDESNEDDRGTMITDISCSISQYVPRQQPPTQYQEPTSRAPPRLLGPEVIQMARTPRQRRSGADTISLASEERFRMYEHYGEIPHNNTLPPTHGHHRRPSDTPSYHDLIQQAHARRHSSSATSSNHSVPFGTYQQARIDPQYQQAPPRRSFDMCADTLLQPTKNEKFPEDEDLSIFSASSASNHSNNIRSPLRRKPSVVLRKSTPTIPLGQHPINPNDGADESIEAHTPSDGWTTSNRIPIQTQHSMESYVKLVPVENQENPSRPAYTM